MKTFTEKQREIVARKMGYDGPMQMFEEYLQSTPSDAQKYMSVTDKYQKRMDNGGLVKKFAEGGLANDAINSTAVKQLYNQYLGRAASEPEIQNWLAGSSSLDQIIKGVSGSEEAGAFKNKAPAASTSTGGATTTPLTTGVPTTGAPSMTAAPSYKAATTAITDDMKVQTQAPTAASVAATSQIGKVDTVETPTPVTAGTITPTLAATGVQQELDKLPTITGSVSDQATAQAITQDPATTAVSNLQAEQAQAGTVAPVADRTVQAGELVSGSAVDMAKAEETLAKTQAAQGVVTEDMTVQGQLNKLLANFDAGTPPPWAAASMRAATAQMVARGLGASSMAGQAIIQATLEAATPIAAADAKTQETMALQNLSNRQATALELGRQRAAFLGQEFDQAFQTRVKNAATVSEIANRNFEATVTIAIENSRIASTTNLANLSSRNALVLAEAAQMANLETANLNNRQLVAVDNAKAFLAIDMKNLDIAQQTAIFKSKTIADSLISDASFANAAAATNATNKLDADKISATLALTAQQYNAAEANKIRVANMDAANELAKFNAEQSNDREDFNSKMTAEISLANAKILAEVSTANTASINAANAVNAKNATDLSSIAYANQTQTYRDLLSYSFKAGENAQDRATQITVASIQKSSSTDTANIKADAESSVAWGALAFDIAKSWI
jgi:hypothetical protein